MVEDLDPVYDPVSEESHENPYPSYGRLREEFPLYHVARHDVWALSRYADIKEGLRDWQTFSSAKGVELGSYVQFFGPGSIQELDPPRHDVLRKVLAPRFLNKNIKSYEEIVRATARHLIGEFLEQEYVDLATEFTQKLPIATIFRILGIPESDLKWTTQAGLEMLSRPPGESGPSPRAYEVRAELVAFFESLVQGQQGGAYSDDVFGDMARAIDGGTMDLEEVQGLTLLLVAAGMETTTSLLGNMVHALGTGQVTGEELSSHHGGPSSTVIDEFLRFDSPAQWLARVTTREVTLHGITLPRDSRVLMIFASGNRDPRVFDNPDELVLSRDGSRNLAFGEGIHFCVGMPLARLETRVGIGELLSALPNFELIGRPVRYPSHVIRGFESIPTVIRR
jgi:cytochrome P450